MSKLDDKFNAGLEEIKTCFVVAQAMAKNSFKIGLERDGLLAALKRISDIEDERYTHSGFDLEVNNIVKAAIAACDKETPQTTD